MIQDKHLRVKRLSHKASDLLSELSGGISLNQSSLGLDSLAFWIHFVYLDGVPSEREGHEMVDCSQVATQEALILVWVTELYAFVVEREVCYEL